MADSHSAAAAFNRKVADWQSHLFIVALHDQYQFGSSEFERVSKSLLKAASQKRERERGLDAYGFTT